MRYIEEVVETHELRVTDRGLWWGHGADLTVNPETGDWSLRAEVTEISDSGAGAIREVRIVGTGRGVRVEFVEGELHA